MWTFDLSFTDSIILIIAGFFAGFINTLAGGGSVITLSVLMFLGVPANIANGTNRIAILIQNIGGVGSFKMQRVLDSKKGIILAIPAVLGSLIGAYITFEMNQEIIEKAIAVVMILMVIIIFIKPKRWLKGQEELQRRKVSFWQVLLFFAIGIYGGFLHMGVGYALLAGIVLGAGYDLLKGNAIKLLIVLLWTPFTIIIFILTNQMWIFYGLILSIGNLAGALIAAKLAVEKGTRFIRWVIVVVVILTALHVFEIIHISL